MFRFSSPLSDVCAVQERIAYSKTLKGRYFDVLGHFFSIYCIYKIFIVRATLSTQYVCNNHFMFPLQCIINIIFDRVGKVGTYTCAHVTVSLCACFSDPVTRALSITVDWLGIQVDVRKCTAVEHLNQDVLEMRTCYNTVHICTKLKTVDTRRHCKV